MQHILRGVSQELHTLFDQPLPIDIYLELYFTGMTRYYFYYLCIGPLPSGELFEVPSHSTTPRTEFCGIIFDAHSYSSIWNGAFGLPQYQGSGILPLSSLLYYRIHYLFFSSYDEELLYTEEQLWGNLRDWYDLFWDNWGRDNGYTSNEIERIIQESWEQRKSDTKKYLGVNLLCH